MVQVSSTSLSNKEVASILRRKRYQERKNPKVDSEMGYVLQEAERHGLSASRVKALVGTRNWGFSPWYLNIGAFRCRLHILGAIRRKPNGTAPHSYPGLTRAGLRVSDFTLFFRIHPELGNQIFIIPSKTLAEIIPQKLEAQRFCIPLDRPRKYISPGLRKINWFSYLEAWHLFKILGATSTSAARG